MSFISDHQQRINAFLEKQLRLLCKTDSRLQDAMSYSLLSGGKRIRPLLVYATAETVELPIEQADYIAAAIEMIHAYSLIHDDLPAMDDDDLRRGKPTNHIAFDEATAILAGDALQTLAFETLATINSSPELVISGIKKLAQASGVNGMAGGQSHDLISEGETIGIDELQTIHAAKTGALLQSCIEIPAVYALHLKNSEIQALHSFSSHLGVAFQIVDDILDVTQNTTTLGKPANSDTKNSKATYPALLGLTEAKIKAEKHINAAYHHLQEINAPTEHLQLLTKMVLERDH